MKIVIVTGGFDPLHSGHISYLNHADHLGDHVVVGLNSDAWLTRKKGRPFMPWRERMVVLDNLHMVGEVIEFNDDDGSSIDAIRKVKEKYPNDEIIFANGGDRTKKTFQNRCLTMWSLCLELGETTKPTPVLGSWKNGNRPRHHVPGDTIVCYTKWAITKLKELTVAPKHA
jgi:cytidyltransferase-like protein